MVGCDQDRELLKAVVASELTDLNKLRTLDVGQFLDSSGKKIVEQLGAVSKADNSVYSLVRLNLRLLKDYKFTTVRQDGDTATVRTEGKRFPLPEEIKFVRVEGKWLPKETGADTWRLGWPQRGPNWPRWVRNCSRTSSSC